jgi:hypothetical protein
MPYVRMVSDEFTKRYPGVKITIQPVPFGQMVQTASTALQNKNPDPTVIIFYPSQASTLGPYLMDLTPYFNSGVLNYSDLPMSAMTAVIMLSNDGKITKIFGVPFQMVFGYVLVYRKSIIENPLSARSLGRSTATILTHPLGPPGTSSSRRLSSSNLNKWRNTPYCFPTAFNSPSSTVSSAYFTHTP